MRENPLLPKMDVKKNDLLFHKPSEICVFDLESLTDGDMSRIRLICYSFRSLIALTFD